MRRGPFVGVVLALVAAAAHAGAPVVAIPNQPGQSPAPAFVGAPFTANPIASFDVPQHPFMARNGTSNIHNDAYMTDAYAQAGPLGRNVAVSSTWLGVEECASIAFDSRGRIVGLCGTADGARLRMLDAKTLETLAVLVLPPRLARPGSTPLNDFCAAGYFYLDNQDRAVLSTNTNQVWVLSETDLLSFSLDETFDLSAAVPQPDCLASVLPDWSGRLWFLSKGGIVGTVDRASGAVRWLATGEAIANSFAVDGSRWRARADLARGVRPWCAPQAGDALAGVGDVADADRQRVRRDRGQRGPEDERVGVPARGRLVGLQRARLR